MAEGSWVAGSILARLKMDSSQFQKGAEVAAKGTGELSKQAGSAKTAFSGLWKQMAAGLGVTTLITSAIRGIKSQFADIINVGRDFERSWANTTTMLQTSSEETKRMKNELLALSPTLGSATDLAKGLYQVLSASIPAGEAVEFLGKAAMSAKAGLTDTFTAVDALTTVLNAYGKSASEVTDVSDIMFESVKRGKLTYEEMASALGTVVPIASQVGVGFDQVGAAMATLTRQGIDANTATVQLRQILVSVLKPSDEAQKTAKALGLEFNAQALATKGLSGFLSDVREKTKGNAETMTSLFGNVRALTGVMGLAGETAQAFKDDLEAMGKASGATEEAFRKQMDSLDFWIDTAKNTLDKLRISLYQGFAEPVKEGIKSSKELELQIRMLQERFQDFGREIGKVFRFVMDNAATFWASLKGPAEWTKAMAERASGISAMKREMLEARIAAEDWASTLTNLNLSQEELALNFGKDTVEGAKWRAEMEALNRELEGQKDHLGTLNGVLIYSAKYMRDQVSAIIETSTSSEEASRRIRELRDFMKSGGEAAEDGAGKIGELDEATKKYKERLDDLLESLGISAERERELYDVSVLLDGLYKSGRITLEQYTRAQKELVNKMFEFGTTIRTTIPPGRDFSDLVERTSAGLELLTYGFETDEDRLRMWSTRLGMATNEILAFYYELQKIRILLTTGIVLPDLDFGVYSGSASRATGEMKGAFDGLFNDIATGFGNTFESFITEIGNAMNFAEGKFFEHGINFRKFFSSLFDDIKTSFFRMLGQMAAEEVLGLFKKLFSSIGKQAVDTMAGAAKNAIGAATELTKGASQAIGGIWTGLGAAVGTFLGTILAPKGLGKTEGAWIHESRNFLAEIRNWFFSAGAGFGGASYEFITGHVGEWLGGIKGSVDETREALGSDLGVIIDLLGSIDDRLKNVAGAQAGAILDRPQLIMTHGSAQEPEWVVPESKLGSLAAQGPGRQVNQVNNFNVNGMMITDRDYVRSRLMPEFLTALNSIEFRDALQKALGIV